MKNSDTDTDTFFLVLKIFFRFFFSILVISNWIKTVAVNKVKKIIKVNKKKSLQIKKVGIIEKIVIISTNRKN